MSNFKKASFPVLVSHDGKEENKKVVYKNGYTFDYECSNGCLLKIGVYKIKNKWVVCDINTGYAICSSHSRHDAKAKFENYCAEKLESLVFSNEHWPTSDSYTNFYEYKSDELAKMIEGE